MASCLNLCVFLLLLATALLNSAYAAAAKGKACDTGPDACANSPTWSWTSSTLRCCPAGYGMQHQSGYINGKFSSECECIPSMSGSSIGGSVHFSSGTGNADIARGLNEWSRRFHESMNQRMRAMANGMNRSFASLFRNFGR